MVKESVTAFSLFLIKLSEGLIKLSHEVWLLDFFIEHNVIPQCCFGVVLCYNTKSLL